MMMSMMISMIMSMMMFMTTSYAKRIEPVGCLSDKYVETDFDMFDTSGLMLSMYDDYEWEIDWNSDGNFDGDTKLCSYQCQLVGAPYMMYTTENKCICINTIGKLGKTPCEKDQSTIFKILVDDDFDGELALKSGNNLRSD